MVGIDDLRIRLQCAGGLYLHGVAAVIAHLRAITDTVGPAAEPVKFRWAVPLCHAAAAVKHGVDAAALGIVFHHPVRVPQLIVRLSLREQVRGGTIFLQFVRRGHITQRIFPDVGVRVAPRLQPQLVNATISIPCPRVQ